MTKQQYIFFSALWYFVNSYLYTANMGGFYTENDKKINRIIPGKLFEYFIAYYLIEVGFENNIVFNENPFEVDNGVDIELFNIPLHLKATTISHLVCQVRNGKGVIDRLKEKKGYLIMGEVDFNYIKIISPYINETTRLLGYGKAGNDIEMRRIFDLWITNGWLQEEIEEIDSYMTCLGVISVEDYFEFSTFIPHGMTFPGTNIKQNFVEGSFILSNLKELKELGVIIPFRELLLKITP